MKPLHPVAARMLGGLVLGLAGAGAVVWGTCEAIWFLAGGRP